MTVTTNIRPAGRAFAEHLAKELGFEVTFGPAVDSLARALPSDEYISATVTGDDLGTFWSRYIELTSRRERR